MLKWVLFIFIFFLTPGIADARNYEMVKKLGDYEALVRMDRNPPVLGNNNIEIEIRDVRGKHITDAKVLVNYYMPPMPRMAPMNYRTDAKLRGEKYSARMNFIMTGPWIIAIKIDLDGKISTAKINIDAQ